MGVTIVHLILTRAKQTLLPSHLPAGCCCCRAKGRPGVVRRRLVVRRTVGSGTHQTRGSNSPTPVGQPDLEQLSVASYRERDSTAFVHFANQRRSPERSDEESNESLDPTAGPGRLSISRPASLSSIEHLTPSSRFLFWFYTFLKGLIKDRKQKFQREFIIFLQVYKKKKLSP